MSLVNRRGGGDREQRKPQAHELKAINYTLGSATLYDFGQVAKGLHSLWSESKRNACHLPTPWEFGQDSGDNV